MVSSASEMLLHPAAGIHPPVDGGADLVVGEADVEAVGVGARRVARVAVRRPWGAPFASLMSPRPSAPPMPEVHAAALHAVFEASTHPAHRVEPAGCNAPGKGITP